MESYSIQSSDVEENHMHAKLTCAAYLNGFIFSLYLKASNPCNLSYFALLLLLTLSSLYALPTTNSSQRPNFAEALSIQFRLPGCSPCHPSKRRILRGQKRTRPNLDKGLTKNHQNKPRNPGSTRMEVQPRKYVTGDVTR